MASSFSTFHSSPCPQPGTPVPNATRSGNNASRSLSFLGSGDTQPSGTASAGLAHVAEENEVSDPLAAGLFGAAAIVAGPKGLAELLREPRLPLGRGLGPRPPAAFAMSSACGNGSAPRRRTTHPLEARTCRSPGSIHSEFGLCQYILASPCMSARPAIHSRSMRNQGSPVRRTSKGPVSRSISTRYLPRKSAGARHEHRRVPPQRNAVDPAARTLPASSRIRNFGG
jgi:hypothetical protein